ncbi:hypothetical protein GYMLUDRAFT_244169 [Collybiopsis luxurians FD-317 M1]|uniref:Ricin B lectin domain-containing protein n=1 Tax=Collybiopsis luxurians FD-317 M1 TaxID=944289 RepID=A0A0D0CDP3_9AGAR|nr:hypothetical protein GYMLUDRAFT_244169 [Collybiopsis luxurians FD-317 M1]
MSPPAAGNYYIKNKASGYYVTSDGKDSSSTAVNTIKPDGDLDDKFVFNLRKGDSDQYFISANYSGANVGAPANIQPGSTVIWTTNEQVFRILDAGPGLYNIRLLGENRFWYDDVASIQPCRTILLNTGRTGDACNWMFQAA